ncbi:hypothetical protein KPSA1_07476 [Pseudomonas syringae pv. actinidiae]|uniref:Uncharacterized protein n=1 Tax=Pseudomonas syringae pv. actinidiae TaxID=103796 RepID=A0A2V0QM15_PSESF|nr:hypothetical protein KPSA1_07476 [Pseudomonas syringae pv. actinidiae]
MQKPRARAFILFFKLSQGLTLQAAQLAEQQWQLACLRRPLLKVLGKALEGFAHLSGQRQCLQLCHQRGQCRANLPDAHFTALLGVQHGFFKARNQGCQTCVHIVPADDFAHFLHAFIDGAIGAFRRQAAAHQTAAQQVEPCVPALFELILLLDAFEVLLSPALRLVAHARFPPEGTGSESPCSEAGRRISTATGR